MMIRRMNIDDLIQVQEIDKQCFRTPVNRSLEAMKTYLNNGGMSSLVYEDSGRIAGYIFHHIMGSFAWFGTFGVHSDFRGKGIGKSLVDETMNILEKKYNCKNIGIVTMPDSSYNIGLYLNCDFIPRELALRLSKRLEESTVSIKNGNKFKVEFINPQEKSNFNNILRDAETISDSLSKGLDMSPELMRISENKSGLGIKIYENEELIGFGVLRNKSIFDEDQTTIHLRLLCIKDSCSSYTEALDAVIYESCSYGRSIGSKSIYIDVNTVNDEICSHLIKKHNFIVDKPSLILIKGDKHFYDKFKGLMLFRTVG